jgi:hypothetical protein
MIKKLILPTLAGLLLSGVIFADTCPLMEDLEAALPPPGWSLLRDPDLKLENYHFSAAIHSLNGFLHYEQIICRYDVCSSYGCPAFALLSNQRYQQPTEANPPWDHHSVLGYTLTCMPGDHNPAHCVFQ